METIMTAAPIVGLNRGAGPPAVPGWLGTARPAPPAVPVRLGTAARPAPPAGAARPQSPGPGGRPRPALSADALERALVNPAAVFAGPGAVLREAALTREAKREILRRWAWDEQLKEVAMAEGMPEGPDPSRLDEVRAALLALDRSRPPGPAAPAARPARDAVDPALGLAA